MIKKVTWGRGGRTHQWRRFVRELSVWWINTATTLSTENTLMENRRSEKTSPTTEDWRLHTMLVRTCNIEMNPIVLNWTGPSYSARVPHHDICFLINPYQIDVFSSGLSVVGPEEWRGEETSCRQSDQWSALLRGICSGETLLTNHNSSVTLSTERWPTRLNTPVSIGDLHCVCPDVDSSYMLMTLWFICLLSPNSAHHVPYHNMADSVMP